MMDNYRDENRTKGNENEVFLTKENDQSASYSAAMSFMIRRRKNEDSDGSDRCLAEWSAAVLLLAFTRLHRLVTMILRTLQNNHPASGKRNLLQQQAPPLNLKKLKQNFICIQERGLF